MAIEKIQIFFDQVINGYIVRFPDMVELRDLERAKEEFEALLADNIKPEKFSLLLDTGAHEFESLECLKYVRTLLSIKPLLERCHRYASVSPPNYAKAEVKSGKEASFNEFSEAYNWLKSIE